MTEAPGISERVERVQARIAAAAKKAGRKPGDITLVAVSKMFGPDIVHEAADTGLVMFGENRVQEAKAKIPECPSHLVWHMVGHLQSNKARLAVDLFDMIHSVDSAKLMETISTACDRSGKVMPVCLEVNVSGEASKHGIAPAELPALLEASAACAHVDVVGLMTLPPFTEDPEKARGYFAQLRSLRDACRDKYGFPVGGLSMGMSHDFEIAIEEGASWVRIGTSIFGKRPSP